jgi:hypothetical protein
MSKITVAQFLSQAEPCPKRTLKAVEGAHWVTHRNKKKGLPVMQVLQADATYVICAVWDGYPMYQYLRKNVRPSPAPSEHMQHLAPQPWIIEVEHAA